MIENLGGVTLQLASVALDAALIRHEVIANNIANSDTPGYHPKRLSFEEHFTGLTSILRNSDNSLLTTRIASFKTYLQEPGTMVVSENGTVELDREMLRLTENTLRYQAILKAAGKQGELLSMAIHGERR